MSDVNHKHILKKFYDQLLEDVDPDKVGTHLAQSKTITEMELRALIINEGRMQTLLRMIANKGQEAYEEFLKALVKEKCFVAYHLLKEEKAISDYKLKETIEELRKIKEELLPFKEEAAIEKTTFKKDTSRTIDHRQTLVTEDHIQAIVDDIGELWRDLGVKLRLSTEVLRIIDADFKHFREKAWEVCLRWKQRKASGATLGVLTDALENIGKRSSARKLLAEPRSTGNSVIRSPRYYGRYILAMQSGLTFPYTNPR